MPAITQLKWLNLAHSCNFSETESVEQVAQIIDEGTSLTDIDLTDQLGPRLVQVSYTPNAAGTQGGDIEVQEAESG